MEEYKTKPISTTLAIFLMFIYSMYYTSVIKKLPCEKDMITTLYSNFVHADMSHLLTNIFTLYSISKVESKLGFTNFFRLILFLIILNTVFMSILYRVFKNITCSIGFSGILFGLMTWELLEDKELDLDIVGSIVLMIAVPSLKNSKVSFIGHAIGALSGVTGAVIWRKMNKK